MSEYSNMLISFLFTTNTFLQVGFAALSFFVAYGLNFLLKKGISNHLAKKRTIHKFAELASTLVFPIVFCLLQWTLVAGFRELSDSDFISTAIAKYATAWMILRFLVLFKTFQPAARFFGGALFVVTSLSVMGLLSRLIDIIEKFSLDFGGIHISPASLVKGGVLFFVLIWATLKASKWAEVRIRKTAIVEPSLQELMTKLIRTAFIAFSVLIALSSTGLDLSAFAVFGGAIGVGIGFGLQKVISNLICGIILLIDRSIKPGDVIALNGGKSYGIVHKLGARCVSVRTRAGKEHLIPNEDIIVQRTENWTFSDSNIRLSIPVPAAFGSDPQKVIALLIEATHGVNRVLESPKPSARLRGFADSEMSFEVRVWIKDPHNGISQVESDIYTNVLKIFDENNIEIPFPVRNLHLSHVADSLQNSFSKYATATTVAPPVQSK